MGMTAFAEFGTNSVHLTNILVMAAEEGLFEVTDHTEISLPTADVMSY